jgi:hypothetical protein
MLAEACPTPGIQPGRALDEPRQHYSKRPGFLQWLLLTFPSLRGVRLCHEEGQTAMATKKAKRKRAKVNAKSKPEEIVAAKKKSAKKRPAAKKKNRKPRVRGRANSIELVSFEQRGLGARSGGQSGDTQGISGSMEAGSESVEELLEEGQSFEAEILAGVENARDADESEVHTREVPEDDVPEEYRNQD